MACLILRACLKTTCRGLIDLPRPPGSFHGTTFSISAKIFSRPVIFFFSAYSQAEKLV